MEQAPWQRFRQTGAEHNHAFILEPSVIRFCCVSKQRGGKVNQKVDMKLNYRYISICSGVLNVSGGLKDMKIFKATQSGFEGTMVRVLWKIELNFHYFNFF